MSLFGSFYSGVSGLNANGLAMGVIGDNIANMNTVGFKRSRVSFRDMMAYPVIGIGNQELVGRGTAMNSIDQQMTQGSFTSTGNGLDMAVSGRGFFVVNGNVGGQNSNFFTRDGNFHVDNEGYMVNNLSLRLQGYAADTGGVVGSSLGDLRFKDASSPAKATSLLELSANLDSQATAIPGGFDLTDPDNTSSFSSTMTVYDSLGAAHDVTVHFTKTGDGAWEWNAVVGADDSTSGNAEIQASGTLTFDTDGRLTDAATNAGAAFNFAGGAAQGQAVTFDFGDPINDGGSGLSGSTQYASTSSVSYQSQDGFATGDLQSVVVDGDGNITGTFSNGQRRTLGQVALADFKGEGLRRMGSNLWQATTESGDALIGAANSGTRGTIASSTLEQSNVDLAQEFVDMIIVQRSYQANSRTITTSDQMIQEVLQLKR
jgi:flagellar hook protein FlgE